MSESTDSRGKQLMDFIEGCESDGVELITGEYYGDWHWNKVAEGRLTEWFASECAALYARIAELEAERDKALANRDRHQGLYIECVADNTLLTADRDALRARIAELERDRDMFKKTVEKQARERNSCVF